MSRACTVLSHSQVPQCTRRGHATNCTKRVLYSLGVLSLGVLITPCRCTLHLYSGQGLSKRGFVFQAPSSSKRGFVWIAVASRHRHVAPATRRWPHASGFLLARVFRFAVPVQHMFVLAWHCAGIMLSSDPCLLGVCIP